MVGTDKRLALVAEDLWKHWEARYAAMEGKAMVVCIHRTNKATQTVLEQAKLLCAEWSE